MPALRRDGSWRVVGGIVDVYSKVKEPVRVPFDENAVNQASGTDISKEDMIAYLEKVELAYDEATNEIVASNFPPRTFSALRIWQKK